MPSAKFKGVGKYKSKAELVEGGPEVKAPPGSPEINLGASQFHPLESIQSPYKLIPAT